VNGETKTVAEWARERGFHLTTLYRRYRAGIRGEAFLLPAGTRDAPVSMDDLRNGMAAKQIAAALKKAV